MIVDFAAICCEVFDRLKKQILKVSQTEKSSYKSELFVEIGTKHSKNDVNTLSRCADEALSADTPQRRPQRLCRKENAVRNLPPEKIIPPTETVQIFPLQAVK